MSVGVGTFEGARAKASSGNDHSIGPAGLDQGPTVDFKGAGEDARNAARREHGEDDKPELDAKDKARHMSLGSSAFYFEALRLDRLRAFPLCIVPRAFRGPASCNEDEFFLGQ